MREITLPMSAIPKMKRVIVPRRERRINIGSSRTWWEFLAVLGAGGGISFGLIGVFWICFASVLSSFEFSRLATAFIVIAFPLTAIGAHALDKLEEINKRKLKYRTYAVETLLNKPLLKTKDLRQYKFFKKACKSLIFRSTA